MRFLFQMMTYYDTFIINPLLVILTVLLIHDTSESEDNFFCYICPDTPSQSYISLRIKWQSLRNFVERPIVCKASSFLYGSLFFFRRVLHVDAILDQTVDPGTRFYESWRFRFLSYAHVRVRRPHSLRVLQATILHDELYITLIRFILWVILSDRHHFSTLVIIHCHDLRFTFGSLQSRPFSGGLRLCAPTESQSAIYRDRTLSSVTPRVYINWLFSHSFVRVATPFRFKVCRVIILNQKSMMETMF